MLSENICQQERLEKSILNLVIESWRFSRLFARVVNKLDAGEAGRYVSQLRYFVRRVEQNLEEAGFKLVNIEGEPFDPGVAASAINIGEFGPDDMLFVEQMIEPIIMGPDGLKREGTVVLRKVGV
jgi:hypothetical protein